MKYTFILIACVALLLPGFTPASTALSAPAESVCLTATAMQEALVDGHALRLADIRRKLKGDIVRADLCRTDGKLTYFVTLLTPDGAVRRVTLDASSGEMVYGAKQ